jgi:hypothetical protein
LHDSAIADRRRSSRIENQALRCGGTVFREIPNVVAINLIGTHSKPKNIVLAA